MKANGALRIILLLAMAFSLRAQQALPVLNIFPNGPFVISEGGVSGEILVFKDQAVEVSAHLEFSGTAMRGIDYFMDSPFVQWTNNFVILATNSSRSIKILIANDVRVEPNETVVVKLLSDPSYTVGGNDTAVLTIADNDTVPTNPNRVPSVAINIPGSGLVPIGTNISILTTAYDTDGDIVRVDVYDRTNLLGSITHLDQNTTNSFTFIWTNVAAGTHSIYSIVTDDRGGTAKSFSFSVTGAEILAPLVAGSIQPNRAISTKTETWFDPLGRANAAVFEFAMPTTAINREGYLFVQSSRGLDTQVFLYDGSGQIESTDLDLPLIYVGIVNGGSTQIDISQWLASFAGRTMGVQLRSVSAVMPGETQITPFSSYSTGIRLFLPENYDVPTQIRMTSLASTNYVNPSDRLSFEVTVSDFDSFPTNWWVAVNGTTVTNASFPALPSGTNTVLISLGNLPFGQDRIDFTAYGNGTSKSVGQTIYVYPVDDARILPLNRHGTSHSFYVLDATGRAHAWGYNNFGQLGLGYSSGEDFYVPRVPTTVSPADGPFRQISAATYYALALTTNGALRFWGNTFDPPPFFVRKVIATDYAAFVLDRVGQVWMWTFDGYPWRVLNGPCDDFEAIHSGRVTYLKGGKLYDHSTVVPFPDGVTRWVSFSIAEGFTLAVGDDGQLYGMGSNMNGELPYPIPGYFSTPRKANPIPNVDAWQRVAASPDLSMALDSHGKLYAWGPSRFIANASPVKNVPTPVQFPKDDVVCIDMALTTDTMMALTDKGEVYVWGKGVPGMWKDPYASEALYPELAPGLTNVLDTTHPLLLANFVRKADGTGPLAVVGARGIPIKIEQSEDFLNWSAVTNFANASGFQYLDLRTTENQKSFLRVVAQ